MYEQLINIYFITLQVITSVNANSLTNKDDEEKCTNWTTRKRNLTYYFIRFWIEILLIVAIKCGVENKSHLWFTKHWQCSVITPNQEGCGLSTADCCLWISWKWSVAVTWIICCWRHCRNPNSWYRLSLYH